MTDMKLHGDTAWTIASYYSSALESETRDLAAQIDLALNEALEECALLVLSARSRPQTNIAIVERF